MPTSNDPLISNSQGEKSRLWPALSAMLRSFELRSDQLLPAMVMAYDRVNNIATVQPMIMWVTVGGTSKQRHEIAEVPVLSLGGGGFHVSFPIKQGDLGWIYAADRDLSLFKQNLAMTVPHTGRAHKFDDSMFVPDVFRQYVINGEDSDAMVIQSVDGATRVSIRTDNIKITAPVQVEVDSPTAIFTGDVVMQKTLTVATEVTVAGVHVTTHGHTSSAPGTRTVGGMIA
jgi:Phage protein Gp138 N-terminal domain